MGRGSNNNALEAKQLLYGSRRGRQMNAEQLRQLKQVNRKLARDKAAADFTTAHKQLRDDLLRGRARNFLNLAPAGHGLKGVEKAELRKTIEGIQTTYSKAVDPSDSSVDMIDTVDDLAGIVTLADRAREAGLSKTLCEKARYAAISYGHAFSNKEIINDLELDQDVIGPLPASMLGDDYTSHLLKNGRPICNPSIEAYRYGPQSSSPDSALTQPVSCIECKNLYRESKNGDRDNCDQLSPQEWVADCLRRNVDYFGVYSDHDLEADSEGSAEDRAEELFVHVSKRTREHLDLSLEEFTDYRLDLSDYRLNL